MRPANLHAATRRGYRSTQIGVVAAVAHQKLVSPELAELLQQAEVQSDRSDPAVATNLREIRRDRDRAAKVPTALVQQIASRYGPGRGSMESRTGAI